MTRDEKNPLPDSLDSPANEIRVLTDAVQFVRDHPSMFFRDAQPSALACVEGLVQQILALGAADVAVQRHAAWWVVSSSFDWFVPDLSAEEQVRRIVPLPELGANGCRAEVIVLAFAQAVATRGSDQTWRVLEGDAPPYDLGSVESKGGRAFAFRFPDGERARG